MSQTLIQTAQQRFHDDQELRNRVRALDLRDRVWEALVRKFRERQAATGMTKADWAGLAGKKPAQVSRMLSGPRNLTIDTLAEMFSALDGVVEFEVVDVVGMAPCNGHVINVNPAVVPAGGGTFTFQLGSGVAEDVAARIHSLAAQKPSSAATLAALAS